MIRIAFFLLLQASSALAWDGVNTETGDAVEIGSGNLVRSGRDIEVYDHGTGDYRDVSVDSIQSYGSTVVIEGTDNATGEPIELEMDRR